MHRILDRILTGTLAVLALAVAVAAADVQDEFKTFLQQFEQRAIPLSRESSILAFNATISGQDADYEKSAQAALAEEKIYADTAAFARLMAFHASGKITDPLLKRQLEILYLSYLRHQVDHALLEELIRRQTDIEQKFNTYRVTVGDQTYSDNQVDSILRHSINSGELEAVWKASKQIGPQVAQDVIDLAKLRNRVAKSLGFANFYVMQLTLGEQNPDEVSALFDELDSLTHREFVFLKGQMDSVLAARCGIKTSELRPWHYQNRFFQEAPSIYAVNLDSFYRDKDPVALVRAYYAGIGLPVDSILAGSDLYEKPGKYQHAECFDIDRSGDVRAICNMRPDYYWMNTILHELGHGVYDYYNLRSDPWLLRDAAHSLTTEAVANFMGRLAANPAWLAEVAGVPRAEADRAAVDCRRSMQLEQVVFSRFAQVMMRFERGLYENPDQDLNKLWWDLVERYQGLAKPVGRNEPDWATKIHIATTPAYYHNYLIAELLASQFAETIGRTVLKSPQPFTCSFASSPEVGRWFEEHVFHLGARYPWDQMIEHATGRKLSSRDYASQFINLDPAH